MITVNYFLFFINLIAINLVFGERHMTTEQRVWINEQYFGQKLKVKTTQASTVEPKLNEKSTSPVQYHSKMHMAIFHSKFGFRDQYMDKPSCKSQDDCAVGIRMICENYQCTCRDGELFFNYPKFGCFVKALMFEKCEVPGQCMAMNPNTFCNPENGRCTCSPNYVFNGRECRLLYDTTNIKAQEVYKAAVVAAACFIVAVVGIFVACIVRRSFCRREQLQQSESNRSSDIFSVSDEIAALRAVDKPPSYEEVLQIERTFYGIPPPEYSGPRSDASLSSLQVPPSNNSVVSDINPISNTEFQSTAVASSSRSSSFSENLTDVDNTVNFGKIISDNLPLQTSDTSDLITAAEVLPVPSDMENTQCINSSLVETSRQIVSHSFTPPPLRHNHHSIKTECSSSSLPSSPYLRSISSKVDFDLMNLKASSRKELEQESEITQQESSHLSENSFLTPSEMSFDMSMPHDSCTNNNTSECEHSVTVIAYDNLGFESDLYF